MQEVTCPHCSTVFSLDGNAFESIVGQIRDEEFARRVAAHTDLVDKQKQQTIERVEHIQATAHRVNTVPSVCSRL